MSDSSTRLDVIVVNFHSEPLIGGTIAIAREFAGEGAGPIVVDNSPGDGVAKVVRSADPNANVIVNSVNRRYAAAVNQAVAVVDKRADAIDRRRMHLTMRAHQPS